MIRVTFLGTSAACPTVARNVSAVFLQREGDGLLFDCGEGTQRQMMRYGTGFSLWGVFITHMHADHFLGVAGMLRTMALQGRREPLVLAGPVSGKRVLDQAVHSGFDRLRFPVEIRPLRPGDRVARAGYEVRAFRVSHGAPALGYVLREADWRGRFDVDKARALGVPEGPAFGRLHRGETLEVNGRMIRPEEVVGPSRPGRTVVYTGDTRPVRSTVNAAEGADLLIHECTFAGNEAARARATGHSTAAGAARIATRAGVKRLALTHISARYSENPARLEREARKVFPAAKVAFDGFTVEIPHREREASSGREKSAGATAPPPKQRSGNGAHPGVGTKASDERSGVNDETSRHPEREALERRGAVDLNQASGKELERIPGIGPVLAARIVARRGETGPFRRLGDLAEVPGVGQVVLEAARTRFFVGR